jgi:dipeptidyl aminopeptidase/acylaminoacyl peptidase
MTTSGTLGSGMAPEDIGALRDVQGTRVSPDGTMVAFTVSDVDLEGNRYRLRVWLASSDGRVPARPFSTGPDDQLPEWSPDGRWLALASSPVEGPAEICVLPVVGGGERVVVASWPAPVTELAWSPDGLSLAFVARVPDAERYGTEGQRRKVGEMPARRLTRLFSRLDNQGWVVDRPNRVMTVPADGSAPPLVLTTGPHEAAGITWSPDGSRIAFASARHETWDLDGAVDLWVVPADGSGEPEKLTGTNAIFSSPSWSPDGHRLAYVRNPTPLDEPRHERVGVLDLAQGTTTDLTTDLDRNCLPHGYGRAPVWFGDHLLCSVEDSGNVHVYAVGTSGDTKPFAVFTGERWVHTWDWAAGTLAMAVSTPTTLPELVVLELLSLPSAGAESLETGSRLRGAREPLGTRLTDLTSPFAARARLSQPHAFMARSADGTEVPCWAMAPVASEAGRRYPTLLNVHGGPFASYGNHFFDEFQIEAGSGFGVLYCNPRGSSGYDEAWGRAVRWPESELDPGSGWGGVDFDDVMACLEEGCHRFDWVDAERVGILGGSYGGYMASWAIGHTDRFKAACSERSCNNLLTLETNSDIAGVFRGYVGRTHLEDPDAYLRQSPITYVSRMTTPVLILHSDDDLRCPVSQAEELFVALRLLGRDPVFVRFPGESHELSRSGSPRHRVERARLIVDWFTEKLSTGEKN